MYGFVFFFQAEDGIRDLVRSRGLGDVYKRQPLNPVQSKKPFLIISTMVYLCNEVTPNHQIKSKIISLFANNPNIPIYKLGFLNNWQNQGLWK